MRLGCVCMRARVLVGGETEGDAALITPVILGPPCLSVGHIG